MPTVIEVLPSEATAAKDLGVLNIAAALPQSVAPLLTSLVLLPIGNALIPRGGYPVAFAFAGVLGIGGSLLVYKVKRVP